MTESGKPPTYSQIETWGGKEAYKFWKWITQFIETNYPNLFIPEWLFGGKKHGWSLRYKNGKSFCTLIPEKNRFAILIVFGVDERAKVEMIRADLSERTQKDYVRATTCHDGKWLLLTVGGNKVINDVENLLSMKRKSNKTAVARP
jgi:hypothetical protein